MSRLWSRWTEHEDAWLRQVWPKLEIPPEAIAHALKRTVYAIQNRAHKLGVKRPWISSSAHLKQWKQASKKGLKKSQEVWLSSPENLELLKRIGKKGRKKAHETWVGSTEHTEHVKRMQDAWIGSPEQVAHLERLHLKANKHNYRGDEAGYFAQHQRARTDFPAPLGLCRICGEREAVHRARIDHTNLPYRKEYVLPMCVSCNHQHSQNRFVILFLEVP